MSRNTLVGLGLVIALAAVRPASVTADECYALGGFGNVYRLRFTKAPGKASEPKTWIISGSETVFADRSVTGSAREGVNNPDTVRIGFTSHGVTTAGATDIHFNAEVSQQPPYPGTYNAWRDSFGDVISGTFDKVSCAGVGANPTGPDIAGN